MDRRAGTGSAPSAGSRGSQAGRSAVDVLGVVLCGGRSRRMGFDKGSAELGGRSLVERAAAILAAVADRVVLACGSEPRYAALGLPLVLDDPALTGPVAGLVAALESEDARWALVLACDMPRVEGALLRALLERARADELDACLLETPLGAEPLCGVYGRGIVPAARSAQAAGRLRVTAFRDHERADGARPRLATLTLGDLGRLAPGDPARNLNTPEELERERRRWMEEERT